MSTLELINKVETVLEALRAGRMIILTDDETRENEGDLVVAAEFATPAVVNFINRHTCGIICLPTTHERLAALNIPLMVAENRSQRQTQFTVSIDAATGISTGVSAVDRAATIAAVVADNATRNDLVAPGHIFPLCAHADGVLGRDGHTEGSVDLMRLAGLRPMAVLCEVMNGDGTMAHGASLENFAKQHDLLMLSVRELKRYRLITESAVESVATAQLPMHHFNDFFITVFKDQRTGAEVPVLYKGDVRKMKAPMVRIHSACFTGDLFHSLRCDCGAQLQKSLERLNEEGGVLIYLAQEGRGIGLGNKIKAYALQEQGMDTVEANLALGFAADDRDYAVAAQILRAMEISNIQLLTNNPAKVSSVQDYGIAVQARIPVRAEGPGLEKYLKTKQEKLGHIF